MHKYTQNIATHYAAYRPPLHALILRRALGSELHFAQGVDVGCGTGYSAIALREFCDEVLAIDPSPAMLARATVHPGVHYSVGSAERVPAPDKSVEIVTFAGSLFYSDKSKSIPEIARIACPQAVIIIYDFEILLGEWLTMLEVEVLTVGMAYDHSTNLSGIAAFEERGVKVETVTITVTPSELAHVLLSEEARYEALQRKYHLDDPFSSLVAALENVETEARLTADIYYSSYVLR